MYTRAMLHARDTVVTHTYEIYVTIFFLFVYFQYARKIVYHVGFSIAREKRRAEVCTTYYIALFVSQTSECFVNIFSTGAYVHKFSRRSHFLTGFLTDSPCTD